VAAELLAVRRYLAGAELAELATRRSRATQNLAVCGDEERELHEAIDRLDEEASSTTAELASRREADLANALGQVQGLIERARGLSSVLRERGRAMVAALDAAADVDVVSTLEAEAAQLAAEIAAADAETAAGEEGAPEQDQLQAASQGLDREESELRARWASVLGEAGDGAAAEGTAGEDTVGESEVPDKTPHKTPDETLTTVRTRSELAARDVERERRQIETFTAQAATLEQRSTRATARTDLAAQAVAELEHATPGLESQLEARLADLQVAVHASETEQASADHAEEERHRTAARAEALERALADLQGTGGRELLREVDGVVGSLVDLVEIDEGWDAAFEAAAGAGVTAVVVDGRSSAQAALATLRERGVTGAVLAPRPPGAPGSPSAVPGGSSAEPVRSHVRARRGGGVAESVLNALVGRAVRVDGWEEAIDLSLAREDLVVVTPEGDRFAATGWRVRSATNVVTGAAVDEARRRAEEAAGAADTARVRLSESRVALGRARDARAAAERACDRHASAREAAEAAAARADEEQRRLAGELDEAQSALQEGQRRLAELVAEVDRLDAWVPLLEAAAAEWRALQERRRVLDARRHDLEVRAAGLAERRRVLSERHAEVERRLQGHAEERASAAARRERLESQRVALVRLEGLVGRERERLDGIFDGLRRDYQDQIDAVRAGGEKLEQLRQDRHTTEQRLDAVRTRTRTIDLEANEVNLRTEALVDYVRRDLGTGPEQVVGLPEPEAPEGTTLVQHAEELERKLAALGPVNPLALEELSALEERHKELESQVDDVRGARRELHEIVRTLDHEIMTSFAAASADVNEHFSALIGMLFPGGTGRLILLDPDDLLNTGVEIEVRPAGRNIRRVSLLSGGERSMASLAFLFAVFRSRPSPFYMMDEVEAALDDVNLTRFLALVHEFRDEAQLLIVSHQKRTMETADALYGVTMAPGGSSQVVSQKVEEPEPA
jgi:chromosome segregation protein